MHRPIEVSVPPYSLGVSCIRHGPLQVNEVSWRHSFGQSTKDEVAEFSVLIVALYEVHWPPLQGSRISE